MTTGDTSASHAVRDGAPAGAPTGVRHSEQDGGVETRGGAAVAAAHLAGRALGIGFGLLARVRGGKPLHPRGALLSGTLEVTGARPASGVPWLEEPATLPATVRLSRSVGLPAPLPDVLGLAVRLEGAEGPADLLLSTTGSGTLTRFLLLPRRDAGQAFLSSLLPYLGPRGPLLFAAQFPEVVLPTSPEGLLEAVVASRPRVELLYAGLVGPWVPFAALTLEAPADPGGAVDPVVSFDPVRHPLPGLLVPGWAGALRQPAYAHARAATGRTD